jgi:exosortase/archaeosortase family protein
MKMPLSPSQERQWKLLQFLARLAALSVPLYIIIALAVDLSALQLAVAGNSAWLLGFMGNQVSQDGVLVGVGVLEGSGFSFAISPDCTGWKSMLFLFGLIFAVPAVAWKRRLIGLALGLPAIWLVNLLRITSAVYAQQAWGIEAAMVLHDVWWQLGLAAAVLAIWYAWLRLLRLRPHFAQRLHPSNNLTDGDKDKA